MKKKIIKNAEKENSVIKEEKISRKEAIKKTGYIALSATTMFLLLSSPSHAQSSNPSQPAPPPDSSPSTGGGINWTKKNG